MFIQICLIDSMIHLIFCYTCVSVIFISKVVLLPPLSPLTQIYKIHLVLDRSIEEHRIIASKPELKSPSQP